MLTHARACCPRALPSCLNNQVSVPPCINDMLIGPCIGTYLSSCTSDAAKVIDNSFDHGITGIDSAEHYANGDVEQWLGSNINLKNKLIISKVHPKNHYNIEQSCDASLKRLRIERIDLYLLHWRQNDTDLSAVEDQMLRLRSIGKIREWGVSNFNINDLNLLKSKPFANQIENNLLRWYPDLLSVMASRDIVAMGHSTLGGGKLMMDKILLGYCNRNKISPAALAMSWAKSKLPSPIIKSNSLAKLIDSMVDININEHQMFLRAMENKHARFQLEQ